MVRRTLAPDVTLHEPHLALFAGEDGLAVLRNLIGGLRDWLRPGGLFVTEIDPSQGQEVAAVADGARFVLGVQGHPEVGDDARLFAGLVAAAAGLR